MSVEEGLLSVDAEVIKNARGAAKGKVRTSAYVFEINDEVRIQDKYTKIWNKVGKNTEKSEARVLSQPISVFTGSRTDVYQDKKRSKSEKHKPTPLQRHTQDSTLCRRHNFIPRG